MLIRGLKKLRDFGITVTPQVLVDGGSENHNEPVSSLVSSGQIHLQTAQIEIDVSNSMIEAAFNRLKNCHLYLQQLKSKDKLIEHTIFYLTEANETIPLRVLRGATPLEMIAGNWNEKIIKKLKDQTVSARGHRIEVNRARLCGNC